MDFVTLFKKISPILRRVARRHNGHGFFIDEDDLYQEMCIYLWDHYKDGVPDGINDAYIVKGCRFHVLNYLRTHREKTFVVSIDQTINDQGDTLKDVLPDRKEQSLTFLDRKITIDEIKNNGFTKKEKKVFLLLLRGYTIREAGDLLGISHVMVIKHKKRLIKKYRDHWEHIENRAASYPPSPKKKLHSRYASSFALRASEDRSADFLNFHTTS